MQRNFGKRVIAAEAGATGSTTALKRGLHLCLLGGMTSALGLTPAFAQDDLDQLLGDVAVEDGSPAEAGGPTATEQPVNSEAPSQPGTDSAAPVAAQDTPAAEPSASPGASGGGADPAAELELQTIPVATQPEPVPELKQPRSRGVIEEIVVTAQKRESSLQDAPMSISAIGSDDMKFRAVNGVADMQSQVPGMSVSESGGSTLVSVRGVGMNVDTGAVEPGVAIHIDGVYQPRPSTGPLGINEIERVEVLRGPQGTLYGRNSTGGVINFILKKPTDTFEAAFQAGMSNYDRRKVSGVVSGPLVGDVLLGRLQAEYDAEGGYTKDLVSGKMSDDKSGYGVRGALRWLPAESLTVDLSMQYRSDEGPGLTARDVIRIPPSPLKEVTSTFFLPSATTRPDQYVVGRAHERMLTYLPEAERETTNGALTVEWTHDWGAIKSVTGYQDHSYQYLYDADFTADTIYEFRDPGYSAASESISEELTVAGSTDSLQWLVGAYYFTEKFDPSLAMTVPKALLGLGLNVRLFAHEETEAIAGFTDLTYSLTDSVRVIGGLRILNDKKSSVQTNNYRAGGTVFDAIEDLVPILRNVLPAGVQVPTIPGVITSCTDNPVSIESNKITPKLGAQWDVNDQVMVYSQYAIGFKSGGSNFSSCGDTYEPEEVKSIEIGIKSNWLDGSVRANASIFDSQYTNFQVLKIAALSAEVVNAPKARITGGELELTALAAEPLLLTSAVSIMNARYEEFSDSDPANSSAGEMDLKGVQLSRAPNYTVNLGAELSWEFQSEWFHYWRFRGEWFKSDDVVYRPYGGPEDGQGAYTLVNAYLSVLNATEKVGLRFFGKNLQDTEYYLYSAADATGRIYGPAGEPRSFGVELSYTFSQ